MSHHRFNEKEDEKIFQKIQNIEELEEEYNPLSEREEYLNEFDTSVEDIIEDFRYEPFFEDKEEAVRYVEKRLHEADWEETFGYDFYSAARHFAEAENSSVQPF